MSSRRHLITERLTAAAEEIFSVFEQNIVEFEEEVNRQRKLLEIVCKPRVKFQRIELPQQHVCKEEEVLTEQQLWNQERNSSLDQEEPESGQIKEEQEEMCSSLKVEVMSSRQCLRHLITERLTAAAEEIFSSFERTIAEFEEEVNRQSKLLEIVCQPRVKLQRIELPQQHVCKEEEVLTEQQLWNQERNSSLDQEEPESGQIKEEQEETCSSLKLEVMSSRQCLRHLITERLTAAAEEIFSAFERTIVEFEEEVNRQSKLLEIVCQEEPESGQIKEEQEEICISHEGEQLEVMSSRQCLRHLITERLTAAAEEIFSVFEGTIVEFEEEVNRQSKLLEIVCQPRVKLQRIELPQQHVCKEEKVLTEQQLWNQERNSSLDREEPESGQIKEEQEEICTSHEGEQLEVKQYSCKMCGKSFGHRAHLTCHERSHTGEKPYFCKTCGKSFRKKWTLTCHERSHTGETPYSCKTCGKSFRKKWTLTEHERVHTGEKPFSCQTCGKSFRVKNFLTHHERTHTVEKPFSCQTCGKSFRVKETLTQHEITHAGKKPFSCQTCGKSFRVKEYLTRHERTHAGKKPFSCQTCGKSFRVKETLTKHERTHTGEKLYFCKTCGKSFTKLFSLTIHERVHTGEMPFSCQTCGKSFRAKKTLACHETIHTGYSCKLCGKSFKHKCGLTYHEIVHTGEKLFSCKTCGKSFASSSSVVKHEDSHT